MDNLLSQLKGTLLWLCGMCSLLLACSATFDSDADSVRLVGRARNLKTLFVLPGFRLGVTQRSATVQPGRDGAPWLVAKRQQPTPFNLDLYRLHEPFEHLSFRADWFQDWPGSTVFTVVEDATADHPGSLHLVPVGGPIHEEVIPVPKIVSSFGPGRVFILDPSMAPQRFAYLTYREGRGVERFTLDWPQDVKASRFPPYFIDYATGAMADYLPYYTDSKILRLLDPATGMDFDFGMVQYEMTLLDVVLYKGPSGEQYLYDLRSRKEFPLGVKRPPSAERRTPVLDVPRRTVMLCSGSEGLERLSLQIPPPPVPLQSIDPRPCQNLRRIDGDRVRYRSDSREYELMLSGDAPREVPLPPRLPAPLTERARCSRGLVVYSTTAPSGLGRLVDGGLFDAEPDPTGGQDAWIDSWKISDRAYSVTLSTDCRRVRWKERADRAGHLGELFSAEIPGGRRLRLGRNVGFYAEIPDGRVLMNDNLTVLGVENRAVLVDEDQQTALLLSDAVPFLKAVQPIPGTTDLFIEIHTQDRAESLVQIDPSVIQLVRMPVPLRTGPSAVPPSPPRQRLD